MALLDNAKKEATTEKQPIVEKKKHNNSEYQKKARARALAAATLIDSVLTAEQKAAKGEGEFATVQDALNVLLKVRQPGAGVASQVSIFEKMFGADAKVGDKVNAYDMLKRTNKNFSQIAKAIKEWEAKGTVVTFDEAKLEYTLTKLA